MADAVQNVTITGQDGAIATKAEPGTPTGYAELTAGANGQVKGTAGADKATLDTLLADKDQVINLGDGEDVFVFRNNAAGLNGDINGIVDGGAGSDHAYMAGILSDYVFSVRSDGGIKIHYVPGGEDGAAVTFRNFETFTFRGVEASGVNHVDQTFSYDALIAAIHAAADSVTI